MNRRLPRKGRHWPLLLLALAGWCSTARAQVAPDRVYYPVRGSITMTVRVPEGAKGEPVLDLCEPGKPGSVASEAVVAGKVDLAALFPTLWLDDKPRVRYAQLRVGDRRIGPPVVLQPMISPARAALDERTPRLPRVVWPPARQPKRVCSGLRTYVDRDITLTTDAGVIRFRLRPDAAPNTAWNVRSLVADGFYDGLAFHRIIATGPMSGEPFLVQTGDPSGTGEGGPGFEIPLEDSPLKHDFGVVSLARQPRETGSGGSQFFICLSRREGAALDGQYAAFGEVTEGMDVVMKIARAPVQSGASDKPVKPVIIRKAELVDAAPFGEGKDPERLESGDGR